MGRKERDKGIRGELEAAKALARLFGCEARRGKQYSGDEDSPDVKHSIPGLHIEVKRRERFRLREAIEQAVNDAGESVPVVLHRANNTPWLAIVVLDDLPELATKLYLTLAENS